MQVVEEMVRVVEVQVRVVQVPVPVSVSGAVQLASPSSR